MCNMKEIPPMGFPRYASEIRLLVSKLFWLREVIQRLQPPKHAKGTSTFTK